MSKGTVIAVIVFVLLFGGVAALIALPEKTGKYDAFAICLGEKGAKFYGAFWCPHCQNQKAMFGRSAKKLPYVECSTPDGRGQLPVCKDAGVTNYPHWTFADGSKRTGEIKLEDLSAITGCPLSE